MKTTKKCDACWIKEVAITAVSVTTGGVGSTTDVCNGCFTKFKMWTLEAWEEYQNDLVKNG